MQLKCVLKKVDFLPMVKSPFFWISEETLGYGSVLEIEDRIGHQLLAQYPEAFEVLSYGKLEEEKPKSRRKQVSSEQLTEA